MFKETIQRVCRGIERLLRSLSAGLSRRWNSMPSRLQKAVLLASSVVVGATCLCIIGRAILSPGPLPMPHPITLPRHAMESGQPPVQHRADRDAVFLLEIHAFRSYLDSLQAKNKKAYDSLAATRPGLLDTLHKLETFYHLNIK